jgi:hypothetical protein
LKSIFGCEFILRNSGYIGMVDSDEKSDKEVKDTSLEISYGHVNNQLLLWQCKLQKFPCPVIFDGY